MPTLPVYGKGEEVARTEVDAIDFLWASQFRWHLASGYVGRGQRRGKEFKSLRMLLHREILGLKHGYRGRIVDHIDGDPLNNTRANLRIVSYSENAHNRKANNPGKETSRHRGVHWYTSKGCWRVAIMVHGVRTVVGYFDDEEEAARAAYDFYVKNAPLANVTAPGPGTEPSNPARYSAVGARAEAAVIDHPHS